MEIEVLNKNHKKKIITIITFIVLAFIVILFSVSLAKYRSSKSFNIARGTVNYKQPDLNLVSVYLEDEDDNTYKPVSDGKIPTSGYTLNEDITKTRCEIKGIADTNIKITYENGEVSFSKLTITGTKCYLYFDKIKDTEAPVIGTHEARNIEKISLDLYVEATDNTGIAGYYFKLSTSTDWGTAKCAGQNSCTKSITGLTPNTSYTYDVKVCDARENCSTTTITTKTKEDIILASSLIPQGNTSYDSLFSGTSGNGIYNWTKGDFSGGSQTINYYRGNVSNNWLVFGKDGSNYIWWRIIRNNSNGSLRIIYAGLSSSKTSAPATTGTGTQIGKNAFNTNYNDNAYVGFKYTLNQVHGTGTTSTILGDVNSSDTTTLYGWYNTKLKTNYASYIDMDAGFCNDRGPTSKYNDTTLDGLGGTGLTTTYYASYIRISNNEMPSLLCSEINDIFKTPVGLITGDEMSMGGIGWGSSFRNTSSFLYTNQYYWTMSPYDGYTSAFDNNTFYAYMIIMLPQGYLSGSKVVESDTGIRPVINLKSDTQFVAGGAGTSTNPYVVSGT